MRRTLLVLALALAPASSHLQIARAAGVPSPESHLGFRPGADFHLAHWQAVVDYFREVDAASDRVAVRTLGETTEGRPFVVGIVSSPATIADLPRFQGLQRRLADPRLDDGKADPGDPVAESKVVVLITCSIHSTETASTLMAMDLLHVLATKDDPATREGPGSDDPPARPLGEPRRRREGGDLVREVARPALGRERDARALPQVRGPRHQPRLVHAQPQGDPTPDPPPLPGVVPDPHLRRPSDGLEGGPAVRPAVLRTRSTRTWTPA